VTRKPNLAETLAGRFLRRPTRGELDAFRDRRLRDLVRHAHRRVPYYRLLFDEHGVDVARFRGMEDLASIPITSRRTLQELPADRITAAGIDRTKLVEKWSSGSTGRKLCVRRTWMEDRTLAALRKRSERGLGIGMRDRRASVTLIRGTPSNDRQWPLKVLQSLGLFRLRVFDCLADPGWVIDELRAYRPDVVGGFSGAMARLAREVGPGDLHDLGIRATIAGGEVLSPEMRRQIEDAFGAPLYEMYGSIEFDTLAIQCPQARHLHVCDDGLILEVLRGDRPVDRGQRGEVVATGLHSYAMPLIRYRLDDVVTRGAARCPCGSPYSTIRAVQGRMLDYFPLPDGRLIHPFLFTVPMLDAHGWIRQYQLTQQRKDRLALRIVPACAPEPARLDDLRRLCAEKLGSQVTLQVELLDALNPEESGKFRVSRSLVHSEYDRIDWDRVVE
jgi:phenylacetate-coenzyme A ligase PaaK-like adenylate-forming protein